VTIDISCSNINFVSKLFSLKINTSGRLKFVNDEGFIFSIYKKCILKHKGAVGEQTMVRYPYINTGDRERKKTDCESSVVGYYTFGR
jgi:hypothetical protein